MTKKNGFLFAAAVGIALSRQAGAFSLLGPYDTWQTANLGYNIPLTQYALEGDSGGPMNIGEEYRWTTPFITYAFDDSFREYFGAKGVAAVEAAIKVLNDLPPYSQLDDNLTAFASNSMRFNNAASQLGMLDLKSVALSALLESLGLAAPERYAWTLRGQVTLTDGTIRNNVVSRNWDPFTFLPSARVNGTLYTYQVIHHLTGVDFWDAMELPVDTADPHLSVVSFVNVEAGLVGERIFSPLYQTTGFYFTGLTKDDVGGLRYLYSRGNVNYELPPSDVLLAAQNKNGATGVVDLQQSGAGGGNYWHIVAGDPLDTATVNVTTGANGSTLIGGTSVPYPYGTLIIGTVAGATNATTVSSNAFTQITPFGKRGGLDKLTFVNVDRYYDPLLMVTTNGYVVTYDDTVAAPNGAVVKQRLGRVQAFPDIIFSANDLGISASGNAFLFARTFANGGNYLNTSVTISSFPHAGPGIIDPAATGGMDIVFSKLGNYFLNDGQSSQATGFRGYMWGSFDGKSGTTKTNPPVMFPPSIDLRAYSRALFGN